jgi:hypothetical protein
VAERGIERGGNRGRARGRLPEDACRGCVHDSARERWGGYGVVGEANERGPMPIDRDREGLVWVRGWQVGPIVRGRGKACAGAWPR